MMVETRIAEAEHVCNPGDGKYIRSCIRRHLQEYSCEMEEEEEEPVSKKKKK